MRPPRYDDFDDDVAALLANTVALRTLIEQPIPIAGSVTALAQRIGTAPSHVSRMRTGHVGIGVETCLRSADVLDEEPFLILHRCGHATLSDRLERLRQGQRLRALLHEVVDRLPLKDRRIIAGLIDRLAGRCQV